MTEDKKKMNYYYGGKEKRAGEIRKGSEEIAPYPSREFQLDFDRLMRRFEREFDDFWAPPSRFMRSMMPWREFQTPSVDLEDQGKEYHLTVDLPGFKKEDVNVEVTDDSVIVSAKRTRIADEKNKTYVRHERSAQTYFRQIMLPESVRSDDAKANLNNGVLEILLPKKAPKETKKLTIA